MKEDNSNINIAVSRALKQNDFIHRYVMAIDHALLWVAALSLAAYFHLSHDYLASEALLFSTLVAYGAYLCESGLETLKTAASSSLYLLDFHRAALWGWIGLNIVVNVCLSLLYLYDPSWMWFVMIIFVAGWQKYMDGRIPPRLQATARRITLTEKRES